MRKNIKLFINNQQVDCSENINLPISYTVEDFKNPTIVKNYFSKTITIPGTPNNNKIFGEIYKLDRFITEHTGNPSAGVQFDPSKRVDFAIYNNAYLIESGYMQLNSISIQQAVISYNITLYGGLGDFFYGLSYKEDGTTKTLSDLQYFITDEEGNVLSKDTEMDFIISKDFVNTCWDWDKDENQIYDFITFVPAYNGLPENFDSQTCLINTTGDSLFPTSKKDSGITYTPYKGYALAKLNKSYTEWEIRDLRSYLQRPAIRLSKLIETICRKENSGYDVIFDKDFFRESNPYWSQSYVALPLLGSDTEDETVTESAKLIKYNDGFLLGIKDNKTVKTNNGEFTVEGSDVITGEGTTIDLSDTPVNAFININLDFQLFFNASKSAGNNLYLSHLQNGKSGEVVTINAPHRESIIAQLAVYDTDNPGLPIAYSPVYNFTNKISPRSPSGPDNWFNYYPLTDAPVEDIYGHFVKDEGNRYYFRSDNKNNTFRFTVKDIPKVDHIRVSLNIDWVTDGSATQGYVWQSDNMKPTDVLKNRITGWSDFLYDEREYTLEASWSLAVSTDTLITKSTLLKTEKSPADYLLSYAKMFGLYFVKDIDSKTIRIFNRNNFFKNSIIDWTGKIDYSKDFNVQPILFDKKWYTMSLDTPETYYAQKYKKNYSIDYGQQRLDTGYNFNQENTDLYSDNVFQNVISVRNVDKYYRNFFNSDNTYIPAFLNDNITYSLFDSDLNSVDQDLYGANFIDLSKTTEWWNVPGNDIFAKTCFYSLSNDAQNLEEISSTLLFFTGYKSLKDIKDNPVYYWLTDDVTEMLTLNDGNHCYIYTVSENNAEGEKIAIRRDKLPQFIRYNISSNVIQDSWDFGIPKEIYISDISYLDTSTLYSKFWKSFYNDQFDVNTRKITCFIKLDDVTYDLLRQFYYFDNAYWILNKIESFDITSDNTTRCEFIKVQDINNYIRGISSFNDYILFSNSTPTVDYNTGISKITVTSNVSWEVGYYSPAISKVTPLSGSPGDTDLIIIYDENTAYSERNFYVRLYKKDTVDGPSCLFTQTPNPDNTVLITGNIDVSDSGTYQISTENDNFTNVAYRRDDGSYKIYAQKGVQFKFQISESGNIKYTEDLILTEDTVKNIILN